jgi:hypothetical protein
MMRNWQQRRVEFNHNRLKNGYLMSLAAWMAMLKGEARDPYAEERFIPLTLPKWSALREEARELILAMEREMAPSGLFRQPPLAGMDEQQARWLRTLADDLWRSREGLWDWTAEALAALQEADEAYARVLAGIGRHTRVTELQDCQSAFEAFQNAVQRLSTAVSSAPSKVEIVRDPAAPERMFRKRITG